MQRRQEPAVCFYEVVHRADAVQQGGAGVSRQLQICGQAREVFKTDRDISHERLCYSNPLGLIAIGHLCVPYECTL